MNELVEFLTTFERGATEDELSEKFPKLQKAELATALNGLIEARLIDIVEEDGNLFYKATKDRTSDYESMVVALLAQAGSAGLWLRDIKSKTNIPHNLILKILRNLETNHKIKSIKSVKTNRKMYMLYDIQPDEEVTGGVWFSGSDVDLIFVEKLMEIICKFCKRREEPYALTTIDSLVKLAELKDFISRSKITEIELSMADLTTLIDILIYDGRLEKYVLDDGIALRVIHSAS